VNTSLEECYINALRKLKVPETERHTRTGDLKPEYRLTDEERRALRELLPHEIGLKHGEIYEDWVSVIENLARGLAYKKGFTEDETRINIDNAIANYAEDRVLRALKTRIGRDQILQEAQKYIKVKRNTRSPNRTHPQNEHTNAELHAGQEGPDKESR